MNSLGWIDAFKNYASREAVVLLLADRRYIPSYTTFYVTHRENSVFLSFPLLSLFLVLCTLTIYVCLALIGSETSA